MIASDYVAVIINDSGDCNMGTRSDARFCHSPYSRTLAVGICAAIVPGVLVLFAAYIAIRDSLYPDPGMLDGIPLEYILVMAGLALSPVTLITSIVAVASRYRDKA